MNKNVNLKMKTQMLKTHNLMKCWKIKDLQKSIESSESLPSKKLFKKTKMRSKVNYKIKIRSICCLKIISLKLSPKSIKDMKLNPINVVNPQDQTLKPKKTFSSNLNNLENLKK